MCIFCKGRFTSCFGSYGVRNRITRTWREGTSADLSDYPESPNLQYCTQGCEISARPAGGALFGGGVRPSFGSPSSATTSPFAPAPPASSLFGSPPPAGAFGAASPAPVTSGFGFGAASPAPATSGFGFGAAPAFSQTPNPAFSQPMAAPAGGILGMPAAVPAPAGGTFGSADALFRVEGAGAYDVVNGDYKVDVAAGLKDGAPCYIKIASREFGYGQVFHTIARRDGKWWMIESVPSQPPRMLYSVAASADDKPPPTGWGRDSCVPFGNGCFAPSAEKMALMPSIVALRAAAATLGAPAAAVPSAAAELEQQLERLHTAVKENKLADVKALLAYVKLLSTDVKALLADVKAGRCESSNLVNMADEKGITALVWAAAIGHGEMVRFLLEAGADKTAVTKKGNNALQAAKLGQAKTGGNARFDEVIRALESPAAFGSFGAPAAGAPSAFGAPAGGGLGATPSAFGSPAGGAFGAVAKPAFGAPTTPVFGAPTPPAFGAATPPAFCAPSSSGAVPSLFAPKPAFGTPGGATQFGAAPAAAPAAGFSFGGTATATVSPLAPASEASSVFGPAPAPPPPLLVGSPEEAYSFGSIGVSPPSPSVGEWVLVPSPADEL